jgi:di/tricarboxylate transporter
MLFDSWLTLSIILVIVLAIIFNLASIEISMVAGITLLMLFGVLDTEIAMAGFSHPAVLMIGGLYVIAAGLEETGGTSLVTRRLLGRPGNIGQAQMRMMLPVALKSAFINNTPVVAMYLPVISEWAKKYKLCTSHLFMPLSFIAILGGTCTLIGTASNITINQLYYDFIQLQPEQRLSQFGFGVDLAQFNITAAEHSDRQFWWMGIIGVPALVLGMIFILLTSRKLLPVRDTPDEQSLADERQYTVAMLVQADAAIVGQSIEAAELRNLPGLYLTEIQRQGKSLVAVSPDEKLQANDLLVFVGIVGSVVDLRKIRGLVPATDEIDRVKGEKRAHHHVEAVISASSPLIGRSVKASRFRTTYNAAIIAIHRNGHRLPGKIGSIELQPGDTLLLIANQGFVEAHKNSGDFYLVSRVEGIRTTRHDKTWMSISILALLVILFTTSAVPPVVAVFLCALLMVGSRCISGTIAFNSINWRVLVIIASAIGIGSALRISGAAEHIAIGILDVGQGLGLYGLLFIIFMMTSICAEFITNNGAAALMFPVILSTVSQLGVNPDPFILVLIISAACTFMTPITYQTNIMVYGPGGYHFFDYFRLGFPLTIIIALLATFIAPLAYPF